MMDERIANGYTKICAELARLALLICGISVIVKVTFLGMTLKDCAAEYIILVGSPLYLAVRSRMLGITQVSMGKKSGKKQALSLVIGLTVAVIIFAVSQKTHGNTMASEEAVAFMATFIAVFVLVRVVTRRVEQRRQKKLDEKYDEQ